MNLKFLNLYVKNSVPIELINYIMYYNVSVLNNFFFCSKKCLDSQVGCFSGIGQKIMVFIFYFSFRFRLS